MTTISRTDLKRFRESCPEMILIDVLPSEEYRTFHIEGAINVPWDEHFADRIRQLVPDLSRMLVVYSRDCECSLSTQALQCLQKLGYELLFDYEPGKADWYAARLPVVQGLTKAGGNVKQQRFLYF